jgi:lipopolysaccharide export system permease protein
VLRPYFVGGVLLGLMLFTGNRFFIPKANIIRSNFLAKYVDYDNQHKNRNAGYCDNCFYRRLDTNTFVGIKFYDTLSKSAQGFFLQRLKGDKVIYNLRAPNLQWDTATKNWRLTNAIERTVDSLKETVKHHPTFELKINLKPGELRRDEYLKDKLTTPELVAFIRKEEDRGTEGLNTYKVEHYRRTATPAAVLLLTIIGAMIASRRNRGGSGVHIAIGFIIATTFVLADRFSTVFATNANFHPLLAAWLPNLVFAIVAYWLYRKTPK